MAMRVAIIGGGPGGLFAGQLIKQNLPDATVEIFERGREEDVFGFGVVFSDATLRYINEADTILEDALKAHGTHWGTIDVLAKGEKHSFTGNGMSAVHRKALLEMMRERARNAGVILHFEANKTVADLADYDVIVAADGTNSQARQDVGEKNLGHNLEIASAKFIWFGTTHIFDGLTFLHRQNEHGNFAVHAYPISDELSTFIVEADEQTWRNAGLDDFDMSQAPGISDMKSKEYLEELFSEEIQGKEIVVNNSRWSNFRGRSTRTWHKDNIVFLGDAIHTAHFSVGSGTKMAMEDSIALAEALAEFPEDIPAAFARYEELAQPRVEKVQTQAKPSLSWWEHFGRYYNAFDPLKFTFHFFTRSITLEKIRKRDPEFAVAAENAWQRRNGAEPLATSLEIGGVKLPSRRLTFDGVTLTDGQTVIDIEAAGGKIVEAPARDTEVSAVVESAGDADFIVVHGGESLTRRLVSEEYRLGRDIPTVIVDDSEESRAEDHARTEIMSGRTDAIAEFARN